MRKLPFSRLVKEITRRFEGKDPLRWQRDGMEALQSAAEAFLVQTLSRECVLCCGHSPVSTLLWTVVLGLR